MSSLKRGFVALRQLVAFNTHLHNSICVCEFPFGKLWAFNLTSPASLNTETERARESNHHKPNDTVAHCDQASYTRTHTCQSTQARVKLIRMSSCNVLTPEHCTGCMQDMSLLCASFCKPHDACVQKAAFSPNQSINVWMTRDLLLDPAFAHFLHVWLKHLLNAGSSSAFDHLA